MARSIKVPISELPLPPPSHILTKNLTPDPNTPTPAAFISDVLPNRSSIQRRARLLPPPAHFSYVNPMPLEFPYEVATPDSAIEDKAAYIEKWLAEHEATVPTETAVGKSNLNELSKFIPKARDQRRELIGLSETCLRDCLPHLDVGDAFLSLGHPTLVPSNAEEQDRQHSSPEAEGVSQELVDVLAGHAVLMSADGATGENGFAPWSLRYSGHQFGVWAGQLGDGRAISILATPHPSQGDVTYELQLKGAGRTPFSRSADGLAVLRSSIREYLCSEAMQALSIPTTRSLGLVSLPDLPVRREKFETACVFTRVAESFIRIGNFEAFSPPENAYFLGGGQQGPDYEGLRILGEWTVGRVLKLKTVDLDAGDAWGKELLFEVARRNAKMVAAWQAYGFMHGVINTDNVSIMGLTIDYGPYAFMDVFDPYHICNHSDSEGRYAYMYQPNMIIYACRALLNALAPLIGAEMSLGNKAVKAGWASDLTPETRSSWRTAALNQHKSEMERLIQETSAVEYNIQMRKRLALRRKEETDQSEIFQPLLDLMEEQKLDFHGTFRKLCFLQPGLLTGDGSERQGKLESFIGGLLGGSSEADRLDHASATERWLSWLEKYAARIEGDAPEWTGEDDHHAARERDARAANPRFVLRQWLLEEVIEKVEKDHATGKRILAKVLQMACSPFESWGAEGDDTPDSELDPETREERRLCGMGERKLLGFQCSCSS
ncbi:hypothetical protein PAXINDRAFT_101049 [Paxillus involutus ATCC 200175]|uniref:Selenoprotein O n=1 Tax=Paxillus involutus ATCC 200175 TaxID=664439 RepID=A0A0C9TZ66_PAXIN|nr:hypothetical protein PAXINDRAFT_101049 [Paxillus involutus ATCC 200175]